VWKIFADGHQVIVTEIMGYVKERGPKKAMPGQGFLWAYPQFHISSKDLLCPFQSISVTRNISICCCT